LLRHPTPTLFPYTTLFRSMRSLRMTGGTGWKPAGFSAKRKAAPACQISLEMRCGQSGRGVREVDDCEPRSSWPGRPLASDRVSRSEEHTSELQSRENLVCR